MRGARIYRLQWWGRAVAAAFFVLAAVFGAKTWAGAFSGKGEPHWSWMMISLVCTAGGALWTLYAFQSAVALSDEAVEVRGPFSRKSLPLARIRGRRASVIRGGAEGGGETTYLEVVPDDDRLPTLKFQKDYNFDAAFLAWFDALPDLDAIDKLRKPTDNGLA